MKVVYKFKVIGTGPDGTKAVLEGDLTAPDGFPSSAFDEAVAACKRLLPGLNVDLAKVGQVVLSKRKRK